MGGRPVDLSVGGRGAWWCGGDRSRCRVEGRKRGKEVEEGSGTRGGRPVSRLTGKHLSFWLLLLVVLLCLYSVEKKRDALGGRQEPVQQFGGWDAREDDDGREMETAPEPEATAAQEATQSRGDRGRG